MGTLFEDLLSPEAYLGVRASAVELRQTHISAVYLLDRDVFKVKRPVDFGFLNFTTLALRKVACEAEAALNRRLSPDVYIGVVPIFLDSSGRYLVGADGKIPSDGAEVVDYAVHMQRIPDNERADVLLEKGLLGLSEVDRIATRIAAFHGDCEPSPGGRELEFVRENVRENFVQTQHVLSRYLTPTEMAELQAFQLGTLESQAPIFQARALQGALRDGHGDLRLEHVYLRPDGNLTILDCIEFNDRFRFGDVASDLAFLTMDLAHHRRVDLAERLLSVYARETNDFDLYSVIDFYEGYRAFVRAKIATFMALDPNASHALKQLAGEEARSYFLLALSAPRTPVMPKAVIAVGGLIAAGKSTLADWLSGELGGPVIEADRTRKHMLGVAATTRVNDGAFTGAYDKGFTDRVYTEMNRRAAVVLQSGRPVILDASFRSPKMRQAAREVARACNAPFLFIECRAPAAICKARLMEREAQKNAVSDGRLAIFDDFAKEWQPVTELSENEILAVDTSCPRSETEARVKAHIATWPPGFVG
ncbi:MAG: AAA family ATPase [Polyangiaceae bacterium]|nr:AAA family ATPase [Polyangiaceae bacterium]